jgi:ribose transport system substrate-binding protein
VYTPPPITISNREKFLRDDLSDEYWFPSALSDVKKKSFYGIKK